MTTVTLSWEDPEDAADFLALRAEYKRDGYLMQPSTVAFLELAAASKVVQHHLVSVVRLTPDMGGRHRAELTCSCGHVEDLTFGREHVIAGQMSYTCQGCTGSHWFPVEEGGSDE